MNAENLLLACSISLVLLLYTCTSTTSTAYEILKQSCASSCGNIHNISYPFRLKSDPPACGVFAYELSCEGNSTLVLYLNGVQFNVKAINYDNYTIRVVDPGVDNDDCSSLPRFALSYSNFTDYFAYKPWSMRVNLVEQVDVLKCVEPVNSTTYLDATPCVQRLGTNSSLVHRYAHVGGVSGFDLGKGCNIEAITVIRPPNTSVSSYIEFYRWMAFGFELLFYECSDYCGFEYCYLIMSSDMFNCDDLNVNIGMFKRLTKRLKNYAEAFGYGLYDLCRYISILFGSGFNIKRVFQEMRDDAEFYSELPYWPNHLAGLLEHERVNQC